MCSVPAAATVRLQRRRREVAARQDRRADAREQFLRNGGTSFGLQGLENKPECLGTPVQIVDHPRAVARLVRRGSGIDVFHSMTHGVVKQHCDLAGRGGYRLGLADAGREPPIKGAERGVRASDGDGSKAQKGGSPAAGPARS